MCCGPTAWRRVPATVVWCELTLLGWALPLPHESQSARIKASFPASCFGLSSNPPAPHCTLLWEESWRARKSLFTKRVCVTVTHNGAARALFSPDFI